MSDVHKKYLYIYYSIAGLNKNFKDRFGQIPPEHCADVLQHIGENNDITSYVKLK
jgi:hypothetical protein